MLSSIRQMNRVRMHSIPFLCVTSPSKFNGYPTEMDVNSYGGYKTVDGQYMFLNGLVAPSPSKACKLVLKRNTTAKTCEWQGPKHVFLYLGGRWKSLHDCDLTLEVDPQESNLARVRSVYGKKVCLNI